MNCHRCVSVLIIDVLEFLEPAKLRWWLTMVLSSPLLALTLRLDFLKDGPTRVLLTLWWVGSSLSEAVRFGEGLPKVYITLEVLAWFLEKIPETLILAEFECCLTTFRSCFFVRD